MKKIGLAVIVLLSCASASFAQSAPAAAPAAAPVAAPAVKPAPVALKMVIGKVDAVVVADAVKGTKASLSVADEKGDKLVFAVTAKTVITDAADKAVALNAFANGEAVKVAFSVDKDGANEAVAIKAVK